MNPPFVLFKLTIPQANIVRGSSGFMVAQFKLQVRLSIMTLMQYCDDFFVQRLERQPPIPKRLPG